MTLTEDAANRPDVNPGGIVSRAEKHLGRPVPESNDLVSVGLERNGEGTSEAEISNLEDALLFVEEQVLGLEIPMKDTMAVTVSNALA